MYKDIFWTLVLLFLTIQLTEAQQRPGGKGQGGPPPMTITGTVTDGNSGQGLEFATISIFSKEGDEIRGGGLTEENGSFSIEAKGRKLYAVIEFLSYESKIIDPIEIELSLIHI